MNAVTPTGSNPFTAETDRTAWQLHTVKKYTDPNQKDDGAFVAKLSKDKTRSADAFIADGGLAELPSYMNKVRDIIGGIRESLDEADNPFAKKDGDGDGQTDDAAKAKAKKKKKKNNPFAKDTEDDDDQGSETDDEDPTDAEDSNDEDEDSETEGEDDQDDEEDDDDQGLNNGALSDEYGGDDLKSQLEKLALGAAELYADVDETQSFSNDVSECIDKILADLNDIKNTVTASKKDKNKDQDEKQDSTATSDVQNNTPPGGPVQEMVSRYTGRQINEISKELVGRYLKKADVSYGDNLGGNSGGDPAVRNKMDKKALNRLNGMLRADAKVGGKFSQGVETAKVKATNSRIKEELDEAAETIGKFHNADVHVKIVSGKDKVTKKPTRHVELHGAGQKTRLITSVHPEWNNEKIVSHLKSVHGSKLHGVNWIKESRDYDDDYDDDQPPKHYVLCHRRTDGAVAPLKENGKRKYHETAEEAKAHARKLNAETSSPHVSYSYGGYE